jgi:hypothetical protein
MELDGIDDFDSDRYGFLSSLETDVIPDKLLELPIRGSKSRF